MTGGPTKATESLLTYNQLLDNAADAKDGGGLESQHRLITLQRLSAPHPSSML
jgi:hypothetical protein